MWCGVQVSNFVHFACGYLVFLAPFVEKTVLSLSIGLDFIKSQLAINAWIYLWALNFIPSFILMPVAHCFDHCSLVVSFEIGNCEFFPENVLAILSSLSFHINFRNSLSISAKKSNLNFDRDCYQISSPLQYSCLENSMDRPWCHKRSDMPEH